MITHRFKVRKDRIDECKEFIRTLPTARFIHNPTLFGDFYDVGVSFETSEDSNKMNDLQNKWYNEDNPTPKKKESFISRILNFFKR
jgi:hypothetical protein